MEKVVLSYKDSIIYESDIQILKSETEWLNDRVITFYFEYLQNEMIQGTNKILLISPEVTQAIKMTQSSDDVREIFLNPQNCDDRNLIIFALNDSSTFDSSGTHWSLLAFSRNEDKFFHFDSMGGGNNSQSRKLVNILKAALDVKSAEIVQVDCLQQNNSYDCGIFVLCLAKNICIHFLKHRRVADVKRLKIEEIYKKRNHLLEIIKNLKE